MKPTVFRKVRMISLTILLYLLVITPFCKINAQVLELEKSFAFPEENKDRALLNVDYNEQNKTFTMIYVTKVTNKLVRFETFVFDYDFNLISQEKNEYEPDRAISLYNWFKYRGEEFVSEGVGVDGSDDLIIRKLEITSKYKWLSNKYKVSSKTLDKVKLKNDDGSKYFHHRNYVNETTSTAYVLVGVNMKGDKLNYLKDLHILKINKEFDIEKNVALKFNEPRYVKYTDIYTDEDDSFKAWIMILGTSEDNKKSKSPQTYNYIYVDKDMNIIDNIQFDTPAGGMVFENTFVNEDENSVYFNGISEEGLFSLLKVADHKVVYAINATPDQLETKFQRPPSQKGGKPFKGSKFEISDQSSNKNGDFFLCGQNWDKGGAMGGLGALQGRGTTTRYTDCCLFQFDSQGKIAGQYSYDTKWFVNTTPCTQYIFEGSGGTNNYWVVIPANYLDWPWDCFIYYPLNIAAIKMQDGKIGDFMKIDNSKISEIKELYLDWNFPLIETEKGKLVLIGKDRPKSCGKNIWLGRLRLD